MKTKTKNIAKISLLVSGILCVALILMQFIPYWTPNQAAIDACSTEASVMSPIFNDFGNKATEDTEGTNAATEATEAKNEKPDIYTGSVSIFRYMFLPSSYPVISEYLDANYEVPRGTDPSTYNPRINSLAGTFCIVFLLGIVSVIFIVLKPNKLWISVFPFVVGVGGLIGYLTESTWAMGSIYIVLVLLSALLTIASAIAVGIWLYSFKFWFMDPKTLNEQ